MCVCLYSKGSLFLDSISVVENFKFRANTGSLINAYRHIRNRKCIKYQICPRKIPFVLINRLRKRKEV